MKLLAQTTTCIIPLQIPTDEKGVRTQQNHNIIAEIATTQLAYFLQTTHTHMYSNRMALETPSPSDSSSAYVTIVLNGKRGETKAKRKREN